jgi:hypothetical protein
MTRIKRRLGKAAAWGAVLVWTALSLHPQQQCTESTGSTREDFSSVTNIDLPKSPAKFWCQNTTGPQNIATLNQLGANFTVTNPVYVPAWINVLTTNDFDLDGWTDYVGCSSEYASALVFVRNMGVAGQIGTFQISHWIDGSAGNASNVPILSVGGRPLESMIYPGITSGDYDFMFIGSEPYGPNWVIRHAWLYRNNLITNGVRTGSLSFTQTDMTAAWGGTLGGDAWGSTNMVSLDFDGDGDVDVLWGNYRGELKKLTNTNNRQVNSSTFVLEPTPVLSTGWSTRGLSVVTVADFDGRNGLDLFVGSVTYGEVRFYKNDGTGRYTLQASYSDPQLRPTDDAFDGAATVGIHGDFDQDGDLDVVIGTDNWNYASQYGIGGKVYFFRNDGNGNFTPKLIYNGQTQSPRVYDFDLGATFDYDNDGDIDFIIADGNHTQNYYIFTNAIAPVYNLQGTAVSKNLTSALDPAQAAITRVRIKLLNQGYIGTSPAGLGLDYYASNDDGTTWKLLASYTGSGIQNANNQAWVDFNSFGTALRWKAVFKAEKDNMPNYDNASYETPKISTLELEYTVVAKREYSRTSAAAANLTGSGGQTVKAVLAATFYFPSFEGRLRAYDVTQMAMSSSSASTLSTVSTMNLGQSSGRSLASGVSILWDAGELLKARSADARVVWTVLPAGASWTSVNFAPANVASLGPVLQDRDGDNSGLIDFIRGKNQPWKLGDIQHSNPIIVGPPSGTEALMGLGFDAFASANANRTKVVYVGANDGMLHAFDANTGQELWAFIPYNLLPKLRNLSQRDPVSGLRTRMFDYFVDGSPVAADVKVGGVWKTVLICGQGKGVGTVAANGSRNYYFALDVTSPSSPVFLWQTSDPTMGETWSVPAVGRVMVGTAEEWVAFVGSGYDNEGTATVIGNRLNAVRVRDGAVIVTKDAGSVVTNQGGRTDIPNAIPGSPTTADSDSNGFIDYVYVGDLDGRLWKLNVTNANTSQWTMTSIYTDRDNYPIFTQPAVWIDSTTGTPTTRLYFGTGGDDAAPTNRPYSFIALIDGATPTVEWYVGDFNVLNLPREKSVASAANGEKFWADPVLSDGIVYFSSLNGSIENVNPCLNLGSTGQLFARYVTPVGSVTAGMTALRSASGNVDSLALVSKARQAVTLGERQRISGTNKREVYINEYDSAIERLEQPVGGVLQIKSWREIFKIIRTP